MTLADRLKAVGYQSQALPDGWVKIEGHLPMSVKAAEQFAADREGEAAYRKSGERPPRKEVMWVERGPGGRPQVFWNDCTPEQIGELLKAITEDAIWRMEPDDEAA